MQINSARVSSLPETVAPGVAVGRGETDAGNSNPTRARTTRLPQLDRFNRWAQMAEAQQKVADAQGSEQALAIAYRQLKQLERKLAQSEQAGSQIRQQLARLDEEIAGDEGPLAADLTPKMLSEHGDQSRYVLDKVDLLSSRNSDEQLRLFFPASGQSSSIALPAGIGGDEVVSRLQQGLASEHIEVRRNAEGQLEFSVASEEKRKLEEPIFFSGDGVRVPAGNPVAIKLTPASSELEKLGDGLSRGETRQEQARLQKLLSNIESSMRELKKYRRQMLSQLEKVKARTAELSEQELARLQQELQQQLGGGDFSTSYSGLVTQANVSRQNVVALLSDGAAL